MSSCWPSSLLLSDRYRDWHLGSTAPTVAALGDKTANIDMTRHSSGSNILFAYANVKWRIGEEIANTIDRGYRLP